MNEKRGLDSSKIQSSKGQVTVFIILALIIVAVGVLIYIFYPQIKSFTGNQIQNPQAFIQSCMKDKLQNTIKNISEQGGSANPTAYYSYYYSSYYNPKLDGLYNVAYLCYTNQYYVTCGIQHPGLQTYIENQIKDNIKETADSCLSEMKSAFVKQGYTVDLTPTAANLNVSIIPNKVTVTFDNNLTLTRTEPQRFNGFAVTANSNLYELLAIAFNIINWEATYGDVPTQQIMEYYHNIIVEKSILSGGASQQKDGTKVYTITDLNSKDIFRFASRSVVYPPGFAD